MACFGFYFPKKKAFDKLWPYLHTLLFFFSIQTMSFLEIDTNEINELLREGKNDAGPDVADYTLWKRSHMVKTWYA